MYTHAMRQPVSPEELEFGMRVASAAAEIRGPYVNPESLPGIEFAEENGSTSVIKIRDSGLARGTLAILDQFGSDKGAAIQSRIFALGHILDDPALKSYVRNVDGPGPIEFRQELIIVAAKFPINTRGGFNRKNFIKCVEVEIATTSGSRRPQR